MLLTQTRRFATTALVKIVSICRSASPESPLAWRSRTLVWRKCLSLLDCIKSVFPTGRRLRRLSRAPFNWRGLRASIARRGRLVLLPAAKILPIRATLACEGGIRLDGQPLNDRQAARNEMRLAPPGQLELDASGMRESGVNRHKLGCREQDLPCSTAYRRPPAAPSERKALRDGVKI